VSERQCFANTFHPWLPRCENPARWRGKTVGNITDEWVWCDDHAAGSDMLPITVNEEPHDAASPKPSPSSKEASVSERRLESAREFAERMDAEVCSGAAILASLIEARDLAVVRAVLERHVLVAPVGDDTVRRELAALTQPRRVDAEGA
jgi:hypothetical protein